MYFEKGTFVHPQTGLEESFIRVGSIRQELENVERHIERGVLTLSRVFWLSTAREALQHLCLKSSSEYDLDRSVD